MSDALVTLSDGARWVLVAVFSLAAIEKGETLRARSAAWHPIMLMGPRRRRHSTVLMSSSLMGDLATVGLLVGWPMFGGVLSVVLILLYTVAALGMHSREERTDCRCFWRFMSTSTSLGLIARNALLAGLAALVVSVTSVPSGAGVLAGVTLLVLIVATLRAIETGLGFGRQASFAARKMKPLGRKRLTMKEGDSVS